MLQQISLRSSFIVDLLSVKNQIFSLFIPMRINLFWNIIWIFVHLLSSVLSNCGVHKMWLYSRILAESKRLIKLWCPQNVALFPYIGWIQASYQIVVSTKCGSIPVYWLNPKVSQCGWTFNLFIKLSVNNIWRVVNIHAILTWWLQLHWVLPTQIVASCTSSFCFWCGHSPASPCSQQQLGCCWCARVLRVPQLTSLKFFPASSICVTLRVGRPT